MTERNLAVRGKQHQILLNKVRPQVHPFCFVCSSTNEYGLSLEFTETQGGVVEACFACDSQFEGYSGCVHGGIVSSLLDGAMTNCMFAQGHTPMTAELKVRFHRPLLIGKPATVRAWVEHNTHRLHFLRAEITQESFIKTRAWGKFLDSTMNEQDRSGWSKSPEHRGTQQGP